MSDLMTGDGDRLAYNIIGDGPPLLLVVGTSLSVGHWPPEILQALSADYQVILYDHRGMGGSSPSRQTVTMSSLALDAALLLDHIGVERAHVLGWSLGSAVAQELALARPELVASLLLYGTWARSDNYQRAVLTALRTPWAHGDPQTGIALMALAMSPETVNAPEFAATAELLQPFYPHTEEQVLMTLQQWDADASHDTLDRLAAIKAATTVMVGEQDLLTPPRLGRVVADGIPGARFELMTGPGSSHGMIYERPQEWLAMVHEHLRLSAIDGGDHQET